MHRCFVEPARWNDERIRLSPDESHHLLHVLRAVAGDRVTVFDGRGREALAELEMETGGADSGGKPAAVAALRVLKDMPATKPAVAIELLQALPKGPVMDAVIEKATELGVSSIVPIMADHVVVRLSAEQAAEKRGRWQRIAMSAAKQCRTGWVPEIQPVSTLDEALRNLNADLFIVGSLGPAARPFKDILNAAREAQPKRIALLIGPEGDLTDAERAAAVKAGAKEVTFGRLVLRVETAAVFGLSLLANEFLME